MQELGPIYYSRAYRMKCASYIKWLNLLQPTDLLMAHDNGAISNSVPLVVAVQHFAGGSPFHMTSTYAISFSELFVGVWVIVNAVNPCPEFAIQYHNKQLEIANL